MATPEEEARVRAWVRAWADRLLLHAYEIVAVFEERASPEDKNNSSSDSIIRAETISNLPYLDVVIKFWPAFFEQSLFVQERQVAHELCHILTQRLKNCSWHLAHGDNVTWREVKDTNETLVDHLATALFRLVHSEPIDASSE